MRTVTDNRFPSGYLGSNPSRGVFIIQPKYKPIIKMEDPILLFNWSSLRFYPCLVLKEQKSRLQDIIMDAAHEFYPAAPAYELPAESLYPQQRIIRIFFFMGPVRGMHLVFKGDKEYIGLHYNMIQSEGHLACASYHEFSHSYDYGIGLLPPYCNKDDPQYILTDIQAWRGEFAYMRKLPIIMWHSEEQRRAAEEELLDHLRSHEDIIPIELKPAVGYLL